MLYVIYGSDSIRAREKLHTLVDQLRARRPDAEYFRMESTDITPASVAEFIGGQGLFDSKYIVALDRVCEDAEIQKIISDQLEAMAQSENVFILFEEKILAPFLKKISKHAHKVQEVVQKGGENKNTHNTFNVFALTDAVGKRDKKAAWVLYQRARAHDIDPLDIYTTLLWNLKSLVLALTTSSAQEAGMKPYPYKKAQTAARNYSLEELQQLHGKLVMVLHESRQTKDLDIELERFVINL